MSLMFGAMSLIAGGAILGLLGYIAWELYRARVNKEDPSVDVAYLRPPAIIDTAEYGPCVVERWDMETQTSGHATVRDANGHLRVLSEVHDHELRPRNVIQCIFGPGPAEWEHIKGNSAKERALRYSQTLAGVSEIKAHKEEKEDAIRAAAIAKNSIEAELEKSVERMQQLQRQQPMFGAVKK